MFALGGRTGHAGMVGMTWMDPTVLIGTHSRNGCYGNIESALPRQFDLMLAATITLPHFLISSEMSLPKSAGEPPSTVPPRLASRALSFGSAMLILTSLLSLSMSSAGVLFGAPMPNHALAS